MSPIDHDPRELERRARNINPGTVETERQITTLLGSCVAVCLYDARLRLAGMNHFLLRPAKPTGDKNIELF